MAPTLEDTTPSSSTPSTLLTTDFLVIGAGPAGASLAVFLARLGHKGIMLSSASGTANTPRAHLVNSAALECIRDADITMYAEAERLGNTGPALANYRWCETVAGVEYARARAWGSARRSEYESMSPCKYMDYPQSLMEPMLVRYATDRKWIVRFSTTMRGFVDEGADGILVDVKDDVTGIEYAIRTKYLFGADGGRSAVAKTLDLPFTAQSPGGFAYNVLFRADLEHLVKNREGNLHICMRLDKDYPMIGVLRMVKPWNEWMGVFFPKGPGAPNPKRSHEEWAEINRDLIGDPNVEIEILDVSGWSINETSADVLSKGNVFCMGDAVHRHPPHLGLGSNTCIQDAFNLAWKLSLVQKGLADRSLLDTYNSERQPVGAQLVLASNDRLRENIGTYITIGMVPYGTSEEDRLKVKSGLGENSKAGRERRQALFAGVRGQHQELHALGLAYGQLYQSSAIYAADEDSPFQPGPKEASDPIEQYDPCTYPGRRLPHVLLGPGSRLQGKLTSTLDIAGKGKFTLFTGIGGEKWRDAASAVLNKFGVEVKVAAVGIDLDWSDIYLDWEEKRGVEEDGCVLVRPDYFVAWRAQESGNEVERLVSVMSRILGKGGRSETKTATSNGVHASTVGV